MCQWGKGLTSLGIARFEVRQGRVNDRGAEDKATTNKSEEAEGREGAIELHSEVQSVLDVLFSEC